MAEADLVPLYNATFSKELSPFSARARSSTNSTGQHIVPQCTPPEVDIMEGMKHSDEHQKAFKILVILNKMAETQDCCPCQYRKF